MNAPVELLRALYSVPVPDQASRLPEMGDALSADLVALWRDPTAERCDAVAGSLYATRVAVLKLGETIRREGQA